MTRAARCGRWAAPWETSSSAIGVERPYSRRGRKHVIAVGTSMGGLISSLEAEQSYGRLDGVTDHLRDRRRGRAANNYQLDGEYALDQLLNPARGVQLVNFGDSPGGAEPDSVNAPRRHKAAATAAHRPRRAGPPGAGHGPDQHRDWSVDPGAVPPVSVQLRRPGATGEFDTDFGRPAPPPFQTTMVFVESGRPHIEQAAGGNAELDGRGQLRPAGFPVLVPAPDRHPLPRRRAGPGRDLRHPERHADIKASIPSRALDRVHTSVHDRPPPGARARSEDDRRSARAGAAGELLRPTVAAAGRHTCSARPSSRPDHCNFSRPSSSPACMRSSTASTRVAGAMSGPRRARGEREPRQPDPTSDAGLHPVLPAALSGYNGAVRPVHAAHPFPW